MKRRSTLPTFFFFSFRLNFLTQLWSENVVVEMLRSEVKIKSEKSLEKNTNFLIHFTLISHAVVWWWGCGKCQTENKSSWNYFDVNTSLIIVLLLFFFIVALKNLLFSFVEYRNSRPSIITHLNNERFSF